MVNMMSGTISALVTPMYPDGTIDYNSLTALVEFQLKNKIDGLAVTGSTGEGSLLSMDEKISILRHVINIVNKQVPIVMVFNDIATNCAVEYVKKLNVIEGIDYYLATTPAYVRPTQAGLYSHFKTIAENSARNIILYNVPGRTGCDLANKTVLQLRADCSNITGIKDATANIARARELFADTSTNFAAYSGDDGTAVEFILNGGKGVISVISNLLPDTFKKIIDEALSGNSSIATELSNKLNDVFQALSLESNPVALKWALYHKGIIRYPDVRLPLLSLTSQSQGIMQRALAGI